MGSFKNTVLVLAAIGAINWGLTALGLNLVNLLLGSIPTLEAIVYNIIALCGIYALYKVFK